jgi:glycosyltransferase involved in cell wall biosynthesis
VSVLALAGSEVAPVVSVVIPCLNEESTIGACVRKARESFAALGLEGEVVVSDNGSTDATADVARAAGAVVVREDRKGYGSAYLAGFRAARGAYFVMGDGDDTYDFLDIPRFLAPLQRGEADMVIGDRLKGTIMPGAMSWSHRWIGNPVLSGMLRLLYRTRVSDAHCGLRAFTREAWERMRLGALGMEFASEMVVGALRERLRIVEIPITYYPRVGESKLEGMRDAWRHVRFMLMFSPSYLFLLPGALLLFAGTIVMLALAHGPRVFFGRVWDYHPLLFGAAAMILGYNLVLFDVVAKSYSMAAGFARREQWLGPLRRLFSLERGLVVGLVLLALGGAIEARIVYGWVASGYGELMAVREVVIGMALMALGVQTLFASFLVGLMQVQRER